MKVANVSKKKNKKNPTIKDVFFEIIWRFLKRFLYLQPEEGASADRSAIEMNMFNL